MPAVQVAEAARLAEKSAAGDAMRPTKAHDAVETMELNRDEQRRLSVEHSCLRQTLEVSKLTTAYRAIRLDLTERNAVASHKPPRLPPFAVAVGVDAIEPAVADTSLPQPDGPLAVDAFEDELEAGRCSNDVEYLRS